ELIQTLKVRLSRLFRADGLPSVLERKMAECSKRFARLFFASELHEKTRAAGEVKTMRFAEQAVYHAFSHVEAQVLKDIAGFEYEKPETAELAKAKAETFMKELKNSFLSRTTPELNRLVKLL